MPRPTPLFLVHVDLPSNTLSFPNAPKKKTFQVIHDPFPIFLKIGAVRGVPGQHRNTSHPDRSYISRNTVYKQKHGRFGEAPVPRNTQNTNRKCGSSKVTPIHLPCETTKSPEGKPIREKGFQAHSQGSLKNVRYRKNSATAPAGDGGAKTLLFKTE